MDYRCGSSGRVPVLQVWSLEFKPPSHWKRNTERECDKIYRSMLAIMVATSHMSHGHCKYKIHTGFWRLSIKEKKEWKLAH
jgi:hypothetical protein